ncbi:MAG: hypothetical protein R2704_10115 [Microthrixaceae bacterium]
MPTGAPSASDRSPAATHGTLDTNRALGGLALAATVAVALGSMAAAANGHRFGFGSVTARLDVGVTVLFVLIGYLLYLPFARALTGGTSPPGVRRYARTRPVQLLPAYWVALLVAAFVYERAQPMTAVDLAQYLTLTNIYSPGNLLGPIPVAWAVATAAAFCVFVPALAWAISRGPSGDEARRVRTQWVGLVAMVAVAIVFRAWVVSSDAAELTVIARKSWLFNHLDTFAAGMALALVQVVDERRRARGAANAPTAAIWRRASLVAAAVAAVAFGAVVALGLSRQALVLSAPQEWARHLLYLAVGTGAVAAVIAGTRAPWFAAAERRRRCRGAWAGGPPASPTGCCCGTAW